MQKFGDLKTSEQVENLHKLIKPHFLRRMKDDVEDSIPPLQEIVIDVGLTNLQKIYYKGIYSKNRAVLASFGNAAVNAASLNNMEM